MASFALIPGGGGDPWEWHLLVPELEARGHDVRAVRMPTEDNSAGWSEYADAVIDAVGARKHLVVVAASMGGFTAPIVPLDEPWPLAAWPDTPTRVLAGRHDRMFPLDLQRRIARERLGLEVDEIDGGHMVALSRRPPRGFSPRGATRSALAADENDSAK